MPLVTGVKSYSKNITEKFTPLVNGVKFYSLHLSIGDVYNVNFNFN